MRKWEDREGKGGQTGEQGRSLPKPEAGCCVRPCAAPAQASPQPYLSTLECWAAEEGWAAEHPYQRLRLRLSRGACFCVAQPLQATAQASPHVTDVHGADCACCCLQDGSRLEITGLEKYQDIKRHILSCIYD